ncbi:MAG: hypothetical protein MJ092_07120 [Lachnospiraceae bacterium]|nr:hypothetical protein [Lachnospiraceae bacterium]
MFKALVKKELYEVRKMYFTNRRKGTQATGKKATGMIILFAFLYLLLMGSFFALSSLFGLMVLDGENDWIYFMIMTIMAFCMGLIGCVMSTTAVLFRAKDNEFLLSMPIPPSKILLARMISVYIIGLIYELMVILPAILYYWLFNKPSVLSIIFSVLGIFILGFLVLAISCLIGWVIALIMSKLKNKNFITVIVSVVFIAAFMYLRFRMNALIQSLAENALSIGESMKGWGYPIYCLGKGMCGDAIGFLAFTAMTAVIFGLVYYFMTKSFLKLAVTNDAGSNKKYKDSLIKTAKQSAALRKKEMKRFTSSPTYMLNCGLGLLFFLIAAVLVIVKMEDARTIMAALMETVPELANMVPVLAVFAVCLLSAFVDIAGPSISLEGPNVWILQSMPVDPWEILKAKIYNHCILTLPPATFCTIVLCIAIRADVLNFILSILCVDLYIIMTATFQVFLDLKRPMLDWVTEVQPIKQSVSVLIDIFAGMLLSATLGALFFLLYKFISSSVYLILCLVIFAVIIGVLLRWLKGKGRIKFADL